MGPGQGNIQARRQARWQALALTRGPVARLLWPLSLLYRLLVTLRGWLYTVGFFRTHRLPVPVIVVGNVVVGGAGKTPTVIALVQYLKARGWQPGVVSRGYGRHSRELLEVLEVQTDTPAGDSGDEPALIQRATGVPVFVGAHRVVAAKALLAAHPQVDVLLCDDGLQHLALARDVAIAVFDERGQGNGWLLPAGLLREPWPPAAGARCMPDAVLRQYREGGCPTPVGEVVGVPVFDAVRRLADCAQGADGRMHPLADLQRQPLMAVAGIARPEVFFEMLRARGLNLVRETAMPDHAGTAAYAALLQNDPLPVVCTEKDAVKLFELCRDKGWVEPCRIWAVPLELALERAFFNLVETRLAAFKPQP